MVMAVAESTGSGVPLPQSSCSEKRPSLVVVLSIFCNFNSIENHTAGIILAESRYHINVVVAAAALATPVIASALLLNEIGIDGLVTSLKLNRPRATLCSFVST